MGYEKQEFIDYPNAGYTILKAAHLKRMDDSLYELAGTKFASSPNLWSISLTSSDMTDKYYFQGKPYDDAANGTNFGQTYPCTEKIYLKDYAPTGAKLVISLKRGTTYTFGSLWALPNGYDTPWGSAINGKLFFYDENDNYLGDGFIAGSIRTVLVPATATYFRFNIHTYPSINSKNINSVLTAMSKGLMVVEGTKLPESYSKYGELVETPVGSVYQLVNDFYEVSPNLWNIKLTQSHLTGKYYFNGNPYTESTMHDENHQATEKIYLAAVAPATADLVIDLRHGTTYRFCAVPTLPNGRTTPWQGGDGTTGLGKQNRLFFYDEDDTYLGNGFSAIDEAPYDTITVPGGAVYFRFNISRGGSTFPAMLTAINNSLMIINADNETPLQYQHYGTRKLKSNYGNNVTETRPIFYNIKDEVIDIISHYSSTHDLRYNMLKKGPNSIFDYGRFFLVPITSTGEVSNDISGESPSWSWSGTDSHAPWIIKAINNADGDNKNESGNYKGHFTGGNHGYTNGGELTNNPATGRTASIKLYADGKEIINGSGYCNQVKICWVNYIQAYNTTNINGTGREVLKEVHESIFDGYEWKEEINIYPLEEIIVQTWYGIQGIGLSTTGTGVWKYGYFKGATEFDANRELLNFSNIASINNGALKGDSDSLNATKFVAFGDEHSFELEIDPSYDLGSGYLANSSSVPGRIFLSGSKVYFWIIHNSSNKTLSPNTNYGLKAFYRFKPILNMLNEEQGE